MSSHDPRDQFLDAMREAGVPGAPEIFADGQIRRFDVLGDKPGSKAGWYFLHSNGDGFYAGAFGSWKTGLKENWNSGRPENLTQEERERFARNTKEARRNSEAKLARLHEEAAIECRDIWEKARPVETHPYLTKKQVRAHGLKQWGKKLVAALFDVGGNVHSLQEIDWAGGKLFHTGGKVKGHFYPIGSFTGKILICEGYATAATLYEIFGWLTISAFFAGNLLAVAQNVRAKYPDAEIVLCADNDAWTDGNTGLTAATKAAEFIQARLVIPRFANVETGPTDFNDLFCLEGIDEVKAQLKEHEREDTGEESSTAEKPNCDYFVTSQGTFWSKPVKGGSINVRLTNFSAKIVGDVFQDDGVDSQRHYELETQINHRIHRRSIPASQFDALHWVNECLGAPAITFPGFNCKEHLKTAIKILSGEIPESRVFTHTGWREIEGQYVYLHGGGAIGALGAQKNIQVGLSGALSRYILPDPPSGNARIEAIQSSLGVLRVAPDRITFPLLGVVTRVVLGGPPVDFTEHYSGPTGVKKTELAALAQQFFGPEMDSRNLPANWSSTGNSLEVLGFLAKDSILVIDDFAPVGSGVDVQRFHKEADRLLRAQGNKAGRGRLRPDASLKDTRFPRGGIVSTGEEIPKGHSLRARIFGMEVSPGDVNEALLTQCQHEAMAGQYARSMASFIHWIATRYQDIQCKIKEEKLSLREKATQYGSHARTPDIMANLALGFRYYLQFSKDCGAISASEQETFEAKCWEALGEAAKAQEETQVAQEPTTRFISLLQSSLGSGMAHIAHISGCEPLEAENDEEEGSPSAYGWRIERTGRGDFARENWIPLGARIGWTDGAYLYLDPNAAYATVQRLGKETGDELTITPQTLKKRLKERGFLAMEPNTRHLTIRKMIEGRRREVLCLRVGSLLHKFVHQVHHSMAEPGDGALSGALSGEIGAHGALSKNEVHHKTSNEINELQGNGALGAQKNKDTGSLDSNSQGHTRDGALSENELHQVHQKVHHEPQKVHHKSDPPGLKGEEVQLEA